MTLVPFYRPLDPNELMDRLDLHSEIQRALSTLSPRQRRVIELRYGLGEEDPSTFETIGRDQGVTRERIRQIEQLALRILRHPSRSRRLKPFATTYPLGADERRRERQRREEVLLRHRIDKRVNQQRVVVRAREWKIRRNWARYEERHQAIHRQIYADRRREKWGYPPKMEYIVRPLVSEPWGWKTLPSIE